MVAKRTPAAKSGPLLTVTWTRSTIGHKAAARGTIRALGLRRLNQSVQVADTPVIRGMLRRVAFLIEVEEPAGAKEGTST
ncbi:MAG: 50S ribosomal protein L30 [Candidatus Limnocylindria bacterium]